MNFVTITMVAPLCLLHTFSPFCASTTPNLLFFREMENDGMRRVNNHQPASTPLPRPHLRALAAIPDYTFEVAG